MEQHVANSPWIFFSFVPCLMVLQHGHGWGVLAGQAGFGQHVARLNRGVTAVSSPVQELKASSCPQTRQMTVILNPWLGLSPLLSQEWALKLGWKEEHVGTLAPGHHRCVWKEIKHILPLALKWNSATYSPSKRIKTLTNSAPETQTTSHINRPFSLLFRGVDNWTLSVKEAQNYWLMPTTLSYHCFCSWWCFNYPSSSVVQWV